MANEQAILLALSSADAAIQSAQAAVRTIHALLAKPPAPTLTEAIPGCHFCESKNLKKYESGSGPGAVCADCNRDQEE
jgi:hypothetical protein